MNNAARGLTLNGQATGIAILCRTIWGEARGEDDIGQQAVAHVILNRLVSAKFGPSIMAVCMARNQFDCWNHDDKNYPHVINLRDDDPELARCFKNFMVAYQAADDFTEESLYYYDPSIPFPKGFKNFTYVGTFGTQKFYR